MTQELHARNLETSADQRRSLDELFSIAYEELRRLASTIKRSDPAATLNPTALVNEAWIKLAGSPGFVSESDLHFKRIAARAMRQVLVEAARRRTADKRGSGANFMAITFDESLHGVASSAQDLLLLDAALEKLAQLHPRQAALVESRYFGGFEVAEISAMLDISEATVLRDWRAAKAWLAHELESTA